MRTIGLAAAVMTTALLAPASAHAAPAAPATCGISLLPEGNGWDMSIVTAADPTGRYIAGRGYPADEADFERYPVLWDAGRLRAVSIPGLEQLINDVNSSGVAVGESVDPETGDMMAPWLIRGGEAVALPGVSAGQAVAINERGDIVGTLSDGVPVVWKVSTSSYGWPQKLPVPVGAVRARVTGIDEDGTAVGSYDDATGTSHAVIWVPDGEATNLPNINRAADIRGGWITGVAIEGRTGVWKRRDPRTGVATPYPQLKHMTAVNSSGWMVGQDSKGGGALLVTDTADVILLGLTDKPFSTFAQGLSDDGHVVAGYTEDSSGEMRAARWECT